MITEAIDEQGWAELRRLYAVPESGALVAMDSRARAFPEGLTQFIRLRDRPAEPRTAMRRFAISTTPNALARRPHERTERSGLV